MILKKKKKAGSWGHSLPDRVLTQHAFNNWLSFSTSHPKMKEDKYRKHLSFKHKI